MPATAVNNETYFTEIEAAFNAGRGSHKIVSSVDFDLMLNWQKRHVPVQVAVRAIADTFSKMPARERALVNSLSFFTKAVWRAFDAWQAGQAGSHEDLPKADVIAEPTRDESELVRAALETLLVQLREFHAAVSKAEVERPTLIENAARLGKEIKKKLTAKFNHRDFRTIETALETLDNELTDALKAHLSVDENAALAAQTKQPLERFKLRWTPENYHKTFEANFTKNVRTHFAAPHLTLFQ